MKKVLLTGANGFIGRQAIPFLAILGYEVHTICYPDNSDLNEDKNIFLHRCNLLNSEEQKQLLIEVKPTHLLHFAWYAVPGKYWTSIENLRWVQASINLLIDFIENGGTRAVFAGSCAEYDWNYGYCSEGITPTRPQTLYGTCKNSFQEIVSQFSKQTGVSSAWGRIFFLYGPYEAKIRLIPSVIISLLQNQPARCTHGNQIRDFLHVEDVASAFVSLLESNIEGPINIASGQPIALKTVVKQIATYLKQLDLLELGSIPVPNNEPSLLVANVERLTKEVGWTPHYTLNEGLIQTIEWWRNRPYA